jgi:hypothetical protein
MHTHTRASTVRALSSLALALFGAGLVGSFAPAPARAQAAAEKDKEKSDKPKEPKEPKDPKGEKEVPALFTSEAPLAITFRTNLKQIRRDKGENAPGAGHRSRTRTAPARSSSVPARMRTRGIWRLKHCEFPPIRLNFAGKDTKNTVFDGVDKPKLVNYCRDTDQYEQYMLQEAQLYRIYQLLTPISHRVRVAGSPTSTARAASPTPSATR